MTKRTKIICTLGPAVDNHDALVRLIEAGMDIARLNFSHGTYAEHAQRVALLKQVRDEMDRPTAIMLDTKGPEIRTGNLRDGQPVALESGATIVLCEQDVVGDASRISQSHAGLYRCVEPGTTILLDDGLIALRVSTIRGSDIVCTVNNDGALGPHKSINVPGVSVDLPALTDKDRNDLLWGIENGVDFVAASFIRSAEDVVVIKRFLKENGGGDIAVIAKIECAAGVDDIDRIEQVSDGIMVARGDLGVEVPVQQVPHIQKNIIGLCNAKHTPVITATQMLDSMTHNPRPTRAEVTDVANAIYDGTDAIMLSGETAVGDYPVEAVRMMAEIACSSEPYVAPNTHNLVEYRTPAERTSPALGRSAVDTAQAIQAQCIVTPTTSGRTARLISNLRPNCPIYAVTSQPAVARRMQLLWGVTPFLADVEHESMRSVMENARRAVVAQGAVSQGDLVVFTAGDEATAPHLPHGSSRETVSAPTNVLYVVEIRD